VVVKAVEALRDGAQQYKQRIDFGRNAGAAEEAAIKALYKKVSSGSRGGSRGKGLVLVVEVKDLLDDVLASFGDGMSGLKSLVFDGVIPTEFNVVPSTNLINQAGGVTTMIDTTLAPV